MRPPDRRSRSPRPRTSCCRPATRWRRRSNRRPPTAPASPRCLAGGDLHRGNSLVDTAGLGDGAGHVDGCPTGDRVGDRDGQLDQGRQPRHGVADRVGDGDVDGDRRDDAVDQGRVGERRRPGGRGRGDLVGDQRDGGVDRGSWRDDRAARGRGRAEFDARSSRCRGRSRAWRRADNALPSRRATAADQRDEMERSVQAVVDASRVRQTR